MFSEIRNETVAAELRRQTHYWRRKPWPVRQPIRIINASQAKTFREPRFMGQVERISVEIDHLIIDKVSGRVAYAVMSFGGFVGLGHSHYPIPWGALTYDTSLGTLGRASELAAEPARLSKGPQC
jgi:hypothetical protein